MFNRTVMFETYREDTAIIIDLLSKYKSGLWRESNLRVTNCGGNKKYMYVVELPCRESDLTSVLNDILNMVQHNITVKNLYVA